MADGDRMEDKAASGPAVCARRLPLGEGQSRFHTEDPGAMKAGTAWIDITPAEPLNIAGQLHERIGEYTHDPLTANAVAFRKGHVQVVLASCDLLFLPDTFVREVQAECMGAPTSSSAPIRKHVRTRALPQAPSAPEARGDTCAPTARALHVLIHCTHTHVGPCTMGGLPGRADSAYMDGLRESLVEVVGRALDDMEEVTLHAGTGQLDQLGFNRRGFHADGTVDMYHGSWNKDFAGLEGPRDGQLPIIFARKKNGDVKVVIPSFATHPTSFEGDCFYSADIPGSVRMFLRRNLGKKLGVVYLTGAAGNTAPLDLENNPERARPWYGEEGWRRAGMYMGAEILKVIASTTEPMPDDLGVAHTTVKIPIRPYPDWFDPDAMSWGTEYWTKNRDDWPRMLREGSPVDVHLSVLRLGDAAICMNPAELYVEHGLAIKKRSPARVTAVAELTDGYVGYVPTKEAFSHGGYSTWPADSSKLAEDAGETIVKATRRLLAKAFPGPRALADLVDP